MKSLTLKPGVELRGLSTQALLAAVVAHSIYAEEGYRCVLTSVADGTHTRGSEHYQGHGVDIRTHEVPAELRPLLRQRIEHALGPEFFVLHEAKGTDNEHIHVHWKPLW